MSAGTCDSRFDVMLNRADSDRGRARTPARYGAGGNEPCPVVTRVGVTYEPALEALGLIQTAWFVPSVSFG